MAEYGFADAVWTPLALLEISAGGGIGSDRPTTPFGLFDNPIYGIGIISADLNDMRWNYAEDDWKDIYYRNRTIDTSDPARLEFYRVILALTYKL